MLEFVDRYEYKLEPEFVKDSFKSNWDMKSWKQMAQDKNRAEFMTGTMRLLNLPIFFFFQFEFDLKCDVLCRRC
jgi:hypothetical protein